jgi:hypothetical protein
MGPARFFIVIKDDGSSRHFINQITSQPAAPADR